MVEEITEEEFKKMEPVKRVIRVFQNAADKINKYNSYNRSYEAGKYNSAYHKVLDAAIP